MDLTRDPRGGRDFEYLGEDPWLAGVMAGQAVRGVQSNHILATVKHYALNAQETGRMVLNAVIGSQAARESDLLAFELAVGLGSPGSVMCSYNEVNGLHSCSSDYLMTEVLKQDWKYPGYVMSDWGAMHAVTDANAGLDQESGDIADLLNGGPFFGAKLTTALSNGTVSQATLSEMAHRILRSEFATGLIDNPPVIKPMNLAADVQTARATEQEAITLLQNNGVLPLSKSVHHIVVIGSNANNGVLSGGGSSQVWPVGGPAAPIDPSTSFPHPMIWDPSPPLAAIAAEVPGVSVTYNNGESPAVAAAAAAGADAVIVFVNQWTAEELDAANLSLPLDPITGVNQDQLVSAVAAANPHTIVVIESGGPILMPWLGSVAAVMEAWYPGSGGGPAIASVLFGDSDAEGRLPITFPQSVAQLPRPVLNSGATPATPFDVDYTIEGANVGYRWFNAQRQTPLFGFGFGLSYTKFSYSGLQVSGGAALTVSFTVTNTGTRAGSAVPQLYLTSNPGPAQPPRLLSFARVNLNPGASQQVSMTADSRWLARWSDAENGFVRPAGSFGVVVATSAQTPVLGGNVNLNALTQGP